MELTTGSIVRFREPIRALRWAAGDPTLIPLPISHLTSDQLFLVERTWNGALVDLKVLRSRRGQLDCALLHVPREALVVEESRSDEISICRRCNGACLTSCLIDGMCLRCEEATHLRIKRGAKLNR